MTKSFELVSTFEDRAVKVSKSIFDFDESFSLHDDKTIKDELIYDTNISSRSRQERRRKNRDVERT